MFAPRPSDPRRRSSASRPLIAIAVVLLVWAWVAAFITLLGGQIVAHFQRWVLEEETGESIDLESRPLRGIEEQGKPSEGAV